MLKFCVLASGSVANSYFLRVNDTRILIDTGLSLEKTEKRLASIGESFRELNGILQTHAHSDHRLGLDVMTKRYHKTIYTTPGTISELDLTLRLMAPHYEAITGGSTFRIGNIDGLALPVAHDAAEPVGFVFQGDGVRVGVATDLGTLIGNQGIVDAFPYCDIVLTESNHDPGTVEIGPYPRFLKSRVAMQHTSNEDACAFVGERLTSKTSTLILGHISANNNDPRLVKTMATKALNGRSTRLLIASSALMQPILY